MSKLPVKRSQINRRNKVILEFDEQKREEYLTGFQKRKNERRKKAKEEEIKMLKEKKKQLKEKKKSEYEEHLKALKLASSSDMLLHGRGTEKVCKVHTMSTHTVTVTELDLSAPTLLHGINEDDDDSPEDPELSVSMTGEKKRNSSGKDKKVYKKNHHVSYTHAHHQRKKVTSAPSRLRLKKELAKKAKRRR